MTRCRGPRSPRPSATARSSTSPRRSWHLAREGLRRRAIPGNGSPDEAAYLGPLEETVALGQTPAESLLWQYNTRWGRSVEPIFEEYAY